MKRAINGSGKKPVRHPSGRHALLYTITYTDGTAAGILIPDKVGAFR